MTVLEEAMPHPSSKGCSCNGGDLVAAAELMDSRLSATDEYA